MTSVKDNTLLENAIYLDREKKNYYYTDFIKNVLTEEHPSWKLHEFIKPYLKDLNNSEKIQSIYSEFPKKVFDVSSLEIVYFKEMEPQFRMDIIPFISEQYKNYFKHYFLPPRDNENIKLIEISKFNLECCKDSDYFRINTFKFEKNTESSGR